MVGLRTGLRGGARARGATAIATFFPRLRKSSLEARCHSEYPPGAAPRSSRAPGGGSRPRASLSAPEGGRFPRADGHDHAPRPLDPVALRARPERAPRPRRGGRGLSGAGGQRRAAIARAAHAERKVRRWPPVYVLWSLWSRSWRWPPTPRTSSSR